MFESADHEPSWDRLHTAGAVMVTVRRARRTHPTRIEMIAFVAVLIVIGFILGASL